MISGHVDFITNMRDYSKTPGFVCGKPVLYLYKPFRRQVRKDNMQWVDGPPVLTLLVPKARSTSASSRSDNDNKDAEKPLHFGGREHRITPRTVLQHGGDQQMGYSARRYQLVEPKLNAKTSLTPLITLEDVLAQISHESVKSAIESADQDKKRSLVEAVGQAVFGDTVFGGDTTFNPNTRRKCRSQLSLESKFGKLAVSSPSLQEEEDHGASIEGLVDECLKVVARSWSEPISESVLDELNRALQEIKNTDN